MPISTFLETVRATVGNFLIALGTPTSKPGWLILDYSVWVRLTAVLALWVRWGLILTDMWLLILLSCVVMLEKMLYVLWMLRSATLCIVNLWLFRLSVRSVIRVVHVVVLAETVPEKTEGPAAIFIIRLLETTSVSLLAAR